MFTNALHADLLRLGLAPNKSLANVRKMPLQHEGNRRVLQATRIVRFPEFYETTLRVFWSIADSIQALPDKDIVLFVQKNKSNEWLAVLFIDYLLRTGMSMDQLIDRIKFTMDAKASDAIVVFLDDGSYSGSQMAEILGDFLPNIKDSLVIVGIPFVTNTALEAIQKELRAHSNRLSSMILYADVMKPLSRRYRKPAIYFDHKVPDFMSTYATYDLYLDREKVRPFYKNVTTWKALSDDLPRVPLNATKIPRAHMIAVQKDPKRNVSKQNQNF
jgi:hypothetical protein